MLGAKMTPKSGPPLVEIVFKSAEKKGSDSDPQIWDAFVKKKKTSTSETTFSSTSIPFPGLHGRPLSRRPWPLPSSPAPTWPRPLGSYPRTRPQADLLPRNASRDYCTSHWHTHGKHNHSRTIIVITDAKLRKCSLLS